MSGMADLSHGVRASDPDLVRGVLVYMYLYTGSVGIGRGSRMRMSSHGPCREQTETCKRTRADTAPDLKIVYEEVQGPCGAFHPALPQVLL